MSNTPPGLSGHAPNPDEEAIEFGCSTCGRLLKVPQQAVGKQAKCPQCDAVQKVPPAASASTPITSVPPAAEIRQATSPPLSGDALRSPTTPPVQAKPAFAIMPQAKPAEPTLTLRQTLQDSSKEYTGRETPTKKLFDRITEEIAKIVGPQKSLRMKSPAARIMGITKSDSAGG